jgi:hypothetical protein
VKQTLPYIAARDRYHAILERFLAWCRQRNLAFCVVMADLIREKMGEPLTPMQPNVVNLTNRNARLSIGLAERTRWSGIPIKNLTTGHEYPSITAAGQALNVSTATILKHIHANAPIDGQLLAALPRRPRRSMSRSVLNTTTGQRFASISAAARSIDVPITTLKRAIAANAELIGHRFVFEESRQQPVASSQ